jgi:hypothetical protein
MSASKHSAVSFGTPGMPPPDMGCSIGPISLHNAIDLTRDTPRKGASREKDRKAGFPRRYRLPVGDDDSARRRSPGDVHDLPERHQSLYFPRCSQLFQGPLIQGDISYP